MSKDISSIVSGWPYDADEVRARWIPAADGTQQIQLRMDLGVFQMQPRGRPDGTRPRGCDSLLDFYAEEETRAPDKVLTYRLEADACAEL